MTKHNEADEATDGVSITLESCIHFLRKQYSRYKEEEDKWAADELERLTAALSTERAKGAAIRNQALEEAANTATWEGASAEVVEAIRSLVKDQNGK